MRLCQKSLPGSRAFSLPDEEDACDQALKKLLGIGGYSESCLGRSPVGRCLEKR